MSHERGRVTVQARVRSFTKNSMFDILGRNPIHPFPARMAAGIALDALRECNPPLRVLDPMAGSGTVLAVARSRGHRAIGFDLDPLAVLLAGVWTRTVHASTVRDKAHDVLDRATYAFRNASTAGAYPAGSTEETRHFIRYWFDEYARRQLTALSAAIRRVHDEDTRDVLWCGFSRLIIAKSAGASLAMDLAHSRPHRVFSRAPVKPLRRFLRAVETVISNSPTHGAGPLGPPAVAKRGDARSLNVASSSIDLVLTSPPYLNGIDYLRCSKFSLVWMGYSVEDIALLRGESVGADRMSAEAANTQWVREVMRDIQLRPALSKRNQGILARYVWDMDKAAGEAARVLTTSGRAVYVVGDSVVRGTYVRNSAILAAVGNRNGLKVLSKRIRGIPDRNRYLPPPRRSAGVQTLDQRLRREVVLVFGK